MSEPLPQESTSSVPINRVLLARDLDLLGRHGPTLLPSVARVARFLPLDPLRALPGILARVLELRDEELVALLDTWVLECRAIRGRGASPELSPAVVAAWERLGQVLAGRS